MTTIGLGGHAKRAKSVEAATIQENIWESNGYHYRGLFRLRDRMLQVTLYITSSEYAYGDVSIWTSAGWCRLLYQAPQLLHAIGPRGEKLGEPENFYQADRDALLRLADKLLETT